MHHYVSVSGRKEVKRIMSQNKRILLVVGLMVAVLMVGTGVLAVPGGSSGHSVYGGMAESAVPFVSQYSVSFVESGLPSGSAWYVVLNGQNTSSTSSVISFLEPNGSYAYTIGATGGYTANLTGGTVTVNGGSASIAVAFTGYINPTTFINTILGRVLEFTTAAVLTIAVIIGLWLGVQVMLGTSDQKVSALDRLKHWAIGLVIVVLLSSGVLVGLVTGFLHI